jgi:hypothetical protein
MGFNSVFKGLNWLCDSETNGRVRLDVRGAVDTLEQT